MFKCGILFLLGFLFVVQNSSSQPKKLAVKWLKTYDSYGESYLYDVLKTKDGGYLLCGHSRSTSPLGSYDLRFFVIKTDPSGNAQWTSRYSEDTLQGYSYEAMYAASHAPDGGFIFGGVTDQRYLYSYMDIKIIKVDSAGNLELQKEFGGSKNDGIVKIITNQAGGHLLLGDTYSIDNDFHYRSDSISNNDIYLINIDDYGKIVWSKTLGGSQQDFASSIQKTPEGGYIVGGYTTSNDRDIRSGNKGLTDFWLIKIDPLGNIQWERTYGGSDNDFLTNVLVLNDGNYLLAGRSKSTDGDTQNESGQNYDYWLVKINNQGHIIWSKTYDSSRNDYLGKVQIDGAGNFLVLGVSGDENGCGSYYIPPTSCPYVYIINVDQDGVINWEKKLPFYKYEMLTSIKEISDSTFIIAGSSIYPDPPYHFWLAKLGPNSPPSLLTLSDSLIQEHSPPNTLIGSLSASDEDLDETHTFSLNFPTSESDTDIFHIEGNELLSKGVVDFELTSDYSINVRATDSNGGYLDTKVNIKVIDIEEFGPLKVNNGSNGIKVYPIPVSEHRINIESFFDQTLSYELIDLQGNTMSRSTIQKGVNPIELGNVPAGTFLIKVNLGSKTVYSGRLLKAE